jgi:cystathionine gamma-synthase
MIRVYTEMCSGVQTIDLDDEYQPGDLCWLETPVNPSGEAR